MHLVADRPSDDEHRRERTALSQYVRRLASSCADPELTRQLNEIARHYEARINDAERHRASTNRPQRPATVRNPVAVLA